MLSRRACISGWLSGLLAISVATPSPAQVRHADAHIHGTSMMTMALSGDTIEMTLEIPAADIVGFERPPATEAEADLIAAAIESLADPLALFAFSSRPMCTIQSSAIDFPFAADDAAITGDEHEHEHEHDNGHGVHTEFNAGYALSCDGLATTGLVLDTRFFEAFPAAQTLMVQGLVDGTAIRGELTRHAPSLQLR